jgi:uncharacterized protein YqjF (DUF2071 family)
LSKRPFLTARWTDLLLVTWKVPDELLLPRLPPGIVLDRWEGSALASLVAFDFAETRAFGLKWPGLVRFPELNLRFYVRHGNERGVCFVREYVPNPLLAATARLLYNEPYRAVPYRKDHAAHLLSVGGRNHRIAWKSRGELFAPSTDTAAHFLKEHSHGFGHTRGGKLLSYRVDHPIWRIWPEVEPKLEIDTGLLYGPEWGSLASTPPFSVVAAEGSAVSVFPAG